MLMMNHYADVNVKCDRLSEEWSHVWTLGIMEAVLY